MEKGDETKAQQRLVQREQHSETVISGVIFLDQTYAMMMLALAIQKRMSCWLLYRFCQVRRNNRR
jgi:hypothetical protein